MKGEKSDDEQYIEKQTEQQNPATKRDFPQ